MEFTLLGGAAIAVASLYAMLWWEGRRGNAAECSEDLWDIALGAIIAGVFAGRIAAMVGDGVNPLTNPADILIVRAGVATGWATVAAIATVAWLGRRELLPVLDGLAAGSLTGLAGWHAGCVVREACLGSPTELPWGMAQAGSTVGRHPVELYAAIVFLVGAIGLAAWRSRRLPAPGSVAASALLIASIVRLLTEPLRPTLAGGPTAWYVAGAAVGVAGLAIARLRSRCGTGVA